MITIPQAQAVLGNELVDLFQKNCGNDKIALNEILKEAFRDYREMIESEEYELWQSEIYQEY